jgi:hypothetical protein
MLRMRNGIRTGQHDVYFMMKSHLLQQNVEHESNTNSE